MQMLARECTAVESNRITARWRLADASRVPKAIRAIRVRRDLLVRKANQAKPALRGWLERAARTEYRDPPAPAAPFMPKPSTAMLAVRSDALANAKPAKIIASVTCLSSDGTTLQPGIHTGGIWTASCPAPSPEMGPLCTKK
jgi:hypothetical protein